MTLDPRNSVRPGQRASIAAEHINFLNRLMRGSSGLSGGPRGPDFSAPYTWIYAKNTTGSTVPRWGVLAIDGVEITPTPSDEDASTQQFCSMPVLSCGSVSGATEKPCISIEPMEVDGIGRVCVAGVVQAKIDMRSDGHTKARPKASVDELESAADGPFDILWSDGASGTTWALIRIGGNDREVVVGKVEADWDRGTCATVNVWQSGDSCEPEENSPTETVDDVVNLSRDVKADSWVIIGRASNRRWYLLEAGKTDDSACRQTIGGEDITTWPGWDATKWQVLAHDDSGCLAWIDGNTCGG